MTNIEISSRINGGDKVFLREYLSTKTQSVFNMAFRELQSRDDAMTAVRSVLAEVKNRASGGTCPVDMDSWLEYLVTASCNELKAKKQPESPDIPVTFGSAEAPAAPVIVHVASAQAQSEPMQQLVQSMQPEPGFCPMPEIKDVSRESNERCKQRDMDNIKRRHGRDAVITAILVVVTLLLAWVLLSLLYLKGIISTDFSFGLADWFNENVLRLFLIGS